MFLPKRYILPKRRATIIDSAITSMGVISDAIIPIIAMCGSSELFSWSALRHGDKPVNDLVLVRLISDPKGAIEVALNQNLKSYKCAVKMAEQSIAFNSSDSDFCSYKYAKRINSAFKLGEVKLFELIVNKINNSENTSLLINMFEDYCSLPGFNHSKDIEPYLAQLPSDVALWYAEEVLGSRNDALDIPICKNIKNILPYKNLIPGKTFSLGEKSLLHSVKCNRKSEYLADDHEVAISLAINYAEFGMIGRWNELENSLLSELKAHKNLMILKKINRYIMKVINARWLEFEMALPELFESNEDNQNLIPELTSSLLHAISFAEKPDDISLLGMENALYTNHSFDSKAQYCIIEYLKYKSKFLSKYDSIIKDEAFENKLLCEVLGLNDGNIPSLRLNNMESALKGYLSGWSLGAESLGVVESILFYIENKKASQYIESVSENDSIDYKLNNETAFFVGFDRLCQFIQSEDGGNLKNQSFGSLMNKSLVSGKLIEFAVTSNGAEPLKMIAATEANYQSSHHCFAPIRGKSDLCALLSLSGPITEKTLTGLKNEMIFEDKTSLRDVVAHNLEVIRSKENDKKSGFSINL